jgi:predicted  nucleic acid-binding Zn-ribbon protein
MRNMSGELSDTSKNISDDLKRNADILTGRFDSYFEQIDQHNVELSGVMTQLSGAVLQGTEQITKKMAETLDKSLVNTQARMTETVGLLTDQMSGMQKMALTSIESSTKSMKTSLEDITTQVRDSLANWSRSAATASTEFGGIHLSIQSFVENLDKAGRLISDNNASMQVTGDRLAEIVTRSTAVMERVNTAINRSTDLQEKFKSLSTVVMGANRDTLEQNTALLRQISNASGLPEAQAESIEAALQSMMEAVKQTGQTQSAELDKYTAQLNRHTQTALNQVTHLVEELTKRLEVLKARD